MSGAERLAPSDIAARIVERARACSIELTTDAALVLARHMQRVLDADATLHLTAIREPASFLERHVGEGLEGAAMLDPEVRGPLLDLGSGNGYPGLPVAATRRGLRPILAEASRRKAAFLRSVLTPDFPEGVVVETQIQRATDLDEALELAVIVCRGMGNWERVLPRLAQRMRPDAKLLVWAGDRMEQVAARATWSRLRLLGRRPLPQRVKSWIWCFGKKPH